MSAPRARGRDDAPPGVAWTRLESPPPPDKRSGLTSSDDAPRYRRGSKRRPKPPKTPPGLVQPLHRSLAIARFEGKGRGYAAVAHVPASAMLLQERPLRVAGDFPSAKDAQRALAKLLVSDRRHDALLGDGASSSAAATSPSSRGGGGGGGRRADADSEPSPMVDEGVDDETWNRALRRVRADAVVRVASRDEGGGSGRAPSSESKSKSPPPSRSPRGASAGFVARLFPHVSVCNHSCEPNAAVSVSDDLVTLYSLRAIAPGEEVTVSYAASLLWLPLQMRRARLARAWGFLCRCARCDAEHRSAVERRERGGELVGRASRHGLRSDGYPEERSGFRNRWEYGETGYEAQFDEEGDVRGDGASDLARGAGGSRASTRRGGGWSSSSDDDSSDDSSSSLSDSSEEDSSDDGVPKAGGDGVAGGGGGGGGKSYFSRSAARKQKKRRGDGGKPRVLGPGRLYNKLVKAGIGADHWQMHATREVLVNRLLSEREGRKDFDLDLLLEHANCAARLAPNHPHFIRLVTLVEEVFKSNRDAVAAERFWLWTIDLLREAIHPDVLFWNTDFKGISERAEGEGWRK